MTSSKKPAETSLNWFQEEVKWLMWRGRTGVEVASMPAGEEPCQDLHWFPSQPLPRASPVLISFSTWHGPCMCIASIKRKNFLASWEKDSDWLSLNHVPVSGLIAVARRFDQSSYFLLPHQGTLKKSHLLISGSGAQKSSRGSPWLKSRC